MSRYNVHLELRTKHVFKTNYFYITWCVNRTVTGNIIGIITLLPAACSTLLQSVIDTRQGSTREFDTG